MHLDLLWQTPTTGGRRRGDDHNDDCGEAEPCRKKQCTLKIDSKKLLASLQWQSSMARSLVGSYIVCMIDNEMMVAHVMQNQEDIGFIMYFRNRFIICQGMLWTFSKGCESCSLVKFFIVPFWWLKWNNNHQWQRIIQFHCSVWSFSWVVAIQHIQITSIFYWQSISKEWNPLLFIYTKVKCTITILQCRTTADDANVILISITIL